MQSVIHQGFHQSDLLDCARGVLQRIEHHNSTAVSAACEIILEMSSNQGEVTSANSVLESIHMEPVT